LTKKAVKKHSPGAVQQFRLSFVSYFEPFILEELHYIHTLHEHK